MCAPGVLECRPKHVNAHVCVHVWTWSSRVFMHPLSEKINVSLSVLSCPPHVKRMEGEEEEKQEEGGKRGAR